MSKISFCASGSVNQEVEIIANKVTLEELVEGLNSGKYATTLHEPKEIEVVESGEKIANIISTDNQLEYTEFDVY